MSDPNLNMASVLFAIGRDILNECRTIDHTKYPDMDAYHKDYEMKWNHALELIERAKSLLR